MSPFQSAACALCDKGDCSAVVIIPAVPAEMKNFEPGKQSLELICPACHRSFSVSFADIEWFDVTDEQLRWGFIGGQPIESRFGQ